MLVIFVLITLIPSLLAVTFGSWSPQVLAGPLIALVLSYLAFWVTNPGHRVPFSAELRFFVLAFYVVSLLYFGYVGVA